MRWALNFLAVIITAVGVNAIYGGFGDNIIKSLYTEGNATQQMILEVLYFSVGILFLCFSVTWVAFAYTLKKLSLIKEQIKRQ
jgi:hypothetical protein